MWLRGIVMNIFQEVKAAVTTRQAAEHYGYHVRRNGMMCCPFHNDKTPSMKVDQNFICFGCQEKGDVIHFTEKLFGLTPFAAAKKLAEDFGLDILTSLAGSSGKTDTHYSSDRQVNERWKQLQKELQFQSAVCRIYRTYCEYLHLLNHWRWKYAPSSSDEEYHPLFVEALQKTDYVNHLLDGLMDGSPEEKAAIVIEQGKEIQSIEARINEYRSGKTGPAEPYYGSDGRSDSDRGY